MNAGRVRVSKYVLLLDRQESNIYSFVYLLPYLLLEVNLL